MNLSRPNPYRSKPRRVIVTGASSGIGGALARRLAARGDELALVARRVEQLDAMADTIERSGVARPVVVPADLATPGGADAVAAVVDRWDGVLDVLVNNAGGGAAGTLWRASDGPEAREAFEVNYWSPVRLAAIVIPGMLERGSGTIVNVTSMAPVMTWPMLGPYAATKAALATATETLRLELAGTGVHVLEVVPGPIATAVQGESALVPGFAAAIARAPMGDPERLAARIVRSVDRRRPRLVYPRSLVLAASLPGLTRRYVIARSRRLAGGVVDDERVLRSGSLGAPEARAARDVWARAATDDPSR